MEEFNGRRRSVTGWGYEGAGLTEEEVTGVGDLVAAQFGVRNDRRRPVRVDELQPPAPRLDPPRALTEICSTQPADRLLHAVGRSFPDVVRAAKGTFPTPPDVIARPRSAAEVAAVLEWCEAVGAACVPFGGGTSVVGGVEGPAAEGPVVTLQLRRLREVLEIDRRSRAARVQAGVVGPDLEEQLRPSGLTLRFFPQSFEYSTVGGWVATRAGGHYATRLTHIDDLVEAVTAVTPRGVWESRRLPASGAGPSPDRLLLGSEGTLGVITECWLRLQDRPRWRASASVRFATFAAAMAGLRALVQSGLDPANCRVLDETEAGLFGGGDGSEAIMVLGLESAHRPVEGDGAWALELLADHGGRCPEGLRLRDGGENEDGDPAATWRSSFLRAPYLRDAMVQFGMIAETFETAVTWDRFGDLHEAVTKATRAALDDVCGGGIVTCRITHAYPDGAAPYFTVIAPGTHDDQIGQWRQIKVAASEAILSAGGTITHHHAVGRDHRPWYDRQRPDLFATALRGAKAAIDPAGILNPGVLV